MAIVAYGSIEGKEATDERGHFIIGHIRDGHIFSRSMDKLDSLPFAEVYKDEKATILSNSLETAGKEMETGKGWRERGFETIDDLFAGDVGEEKAPLDVLGG